MSFNNIVVDEFIWDDRYISEKLRQKIKAEKQNEVIKRNKYFFELYYGGLEISSYWQNSLDFTKDIDFYNIKESKTETSKDVNYQYDNYETSSDESDSESEFETL